MRRSESPAAGLNNPYRKAAAPRKNNSTVTVRKSPEPRARSQARAHAYYARFIPPPLLAITRLLTAACHAAATGDEELYVYHGAETFCRPETWAGRF